jgi:hypothetical protein
MAISDTKYRIKVDNTYSSNANANTVATAINNVMIAAGRPERASVSTTNVLLLVVGLTESEGVTLRNSLNAAWTTATRSYGKASLVRTSDLD